MQQCQARAHRYVTTDGVRKLYEGPCVLPEIGHDGEHLPAELAYAQMHAATYNQAITEVLTMLETSKGLDTPLAELIALMRKPIAQ